MNTGNVIFKNIIIWVKNNSAFFIGLLIVLVLSFITFHGDLTSLSKIAQRVASGNLNLYGGYYTAEGYQGPPIMPPLILLVDGLFFFIVKALGIIRFDFGFFPTSLWQIFALKTRYILVFILSYPLIKRVALQFTKDISQSKVIANLWITSPILLYLTFSQGNNDIYPAFFLILTFYFIFNEKLFWGMFFLGLSACLKNFGIFLIVPFALILGEKNIKKSILLAATSCIAFVLPILPYIKDLRSFIIGNGEASFIFRTILPSRNDYLIFPLAYFLIILFLYFSDNLEEIKAKRNEILIKYGFIVMALFYSLSFFLPQWLLWILPFMVFVVYKDRKLFYLYLLIVCLSLFSLIVNYNNNLDLGLFRQVLPAFTPGTKIFPGIESNKVVSMVYTAFLSLFLMLSFFIFKRKKVTEKLGRHYIFLNLAPLLLLALALIVSLFFTLRASEDTAKLQGKLVSNYELNNDIITQYSADTISMAGIPFNAEITDDVIKPKSSDPGVILPFNHEGTFQNNTYFVIKYGDNRIYSPHYFWTTSDTMTFSDYLSSSEFVKIDGGYYYAKIPSKFSSSGIKYLRVDPDKTSASLKIEYIKIISIQ